MPTPSIDTLTRRACKMTARPDRPQSALTGIDVLDMATGIAGAVPTVFPCDNGANVIRTVQDAGHSVRAEHGCALWDRGNVAVAIDVAGKADVSFARSGTTDEGMDETQVRYNKMVSQLNVPVRGRCRWAGFLSASR